MHLRTAITSFIAVISFLFLAHTLAFADPGAAPGTWALTWLVPYVPVLIPLLSALQAVVAREMSDEAGFWHSASGHVLLVIFGAVLGSLLDFLSAGTFTKSALVSAVAGAVSAFAGAWKTGGKVNGGLQ